MQSSMVKIGIGFTSDECSRFATEVAACIVAVVAVVVGG